MAKKRMPNISKEEMIKLVTKSLNDQGIKIGETLVELIVREYLRAIKYYLQRGYSTDIGDMGDLLPAWRRVRQGDTCIEVGKVKLDLTDKMKELLNKKLREDEEFRINVGRTEEE